MPLAALAQVPTPVADDLRAESGDDGAVRRHREVREVPADDAAQPSSLVLPAASLDSVGAPESLISQLDTVLVHAPVERFDDVVADTAA